jgi:hypothetical protein
MPAKVAQNRGPSPASSNYYMIHQIMYTDQSIATVTRMKMLSIFIRATTAFTIVIDPTLSRNLDHVCKLSVSLRSQAGLVQIDCWDLF